MGASKKYEIKGDTLFYRPAVEGSLAHAVQLVADAIAHARKQGIPKALVSTVGLTGFPPPNPADRYFLFREWAAASQGKVKVAFIALPEMIDPQKFGITVARNAGFDANAFTAEAAALAWLARGDEDQAS